MTNTAISPAALSRVNLKLFVLLFLIGWSVAVFISLWEDLEIVNENAFEQAKLQARIALAKDMSYRRWNAGHGGVYVEVTPETQPNPYLSVPERDIVTPQGRELTLINPAYMTRQVHEIVENELGIMGHLTSLNPLRPENTPDSWEVEALHAFESGTKEYFSREEIGGREYLRLMWPFVTEKGCLKCHAAQGYHEGDLRGGLSVSVPMEPLLQLGRSHIISEIWWHGFLWLLGCAVIALFGWRLNVSFKQQQHGVNQLMRSEEKFRTMFAVSPEAIFLVDKEGVILDGNDRFADWLGYQKEELIGKRFQELSCLSEGGKIQAETVLHKRFSNLTVASHELEFIAKSGERRIGLIKDALVRDVQKDRIHDLLCVTDITEQKRNEEKIKRRSLDLLILNEIIKEIASSLDLKQVLHNIVQKAVALLDGDAGCIAQFNEATGEMSYPECYNLPAQVKDVIAQQGQGVASQVMVSGTSVIIEEYPGHPKAIRAFVEAGVRTLAVVPISSGEVSFGALGIFGLSKEKRFSASRLPLLEVVGRQAAIAIENARLYKGQKDASKRLAQKVVELARVNKNYSDAQQALQKSLKDLSKTHRELQEKSDDLERSNNDLQQFAYVVSHDLQEPLRMVGSYVELLGRRYKGKLDSDADDFIHYAVDGAHRMKEMINALLTYSRVGSRARDYRRVDCEVVLAKGLSNLQLALEECGADVQHDPLPAVVGDEQQLIQLFQNLIGNAVKFRANDRALQIRVSVEENENGWLFAVADNGIGLKPEYQERIFHIFQRLHRKDTVPGTGIGLAVCRKIVERHGGRLWVEAQPDQGATFYFTLVGADPPSEV